MDFMWKKKMHKNTYPDGSVGEFTNQEEFLAECQSLIIEFNLVPTAMRFEGLDEPANENVRMVGNNTNWKRTP